MKPKVKTVTCPDVTSNQCIVWEGGEVPCLGICNGMQLSEAEKIIADKVCALVDDLDVSELDLACLIAKADAKDKSLKDILQLLLDNQCTLKTLIDQAGGGTTTVSINLNLKCLKKFDEFDNEIPQDLNQALQSIVNQVCSSKDDILLLKNQMADLQDQVDSIPIIPPTIEEPRISTCLTTGLRPISQTVPLVATEVCNIKTVIGNLEQVSGALAQQCEGLNEIYQTTPGWQLSAATLAQSVTNMWIVICDLKDRITLIEENCCAVTCDDIKLGFSVTPNEDANAISLRFTSAAGTSIPIGFIDCGSTVSITDVDGNNVVYPLVISNNATQGEFDVTGMNLSDFLTIEVTAKLCAESISCEKCVNRLYKMNNMLCPFCEIVVTGVEGEEVVIVYEI